MMKILKLKLGDPDFHFFEKLPAQLYGKATTKENVDPDGLSHCYVLMENGTAQARLALYQNPKLMHNDLPTACIGYYESVDHPKISNKIITTALEDAKSLGAKYIIGPMNGSTWNNYRFSTQHNHPAFFMEPHHALYYNEQFKAAGFGVLAKYFSSLDTQMTYNHSTVVAREKELLERGVTIRKIDLDNYEKELTLLYPFTLEAFKTNFLYSPISWNSFRKKYLEAKRVIDPKYVLLAEDATKNIIGLFFCIPDLCNQKEKSLIVKTIARAPDEQWRGLGHVLANQIMRTASAEGYTSMVHAFIKEEGTSTKMSKHFSGIIYKNYVLYGKEIK